MTVKTESNTATLFLDFSRGKLLEQYWPRMRDCVESLTDEQTRLYCRLINDSIRDRPAEFSEREVIPASKLLEQLSRTMQEASEVLNRLTEADLLAPYQIQGHDVTGLGGVYQVVEHFGLHYGQILYVTKLLRGEDLGFYKHLNKTGRTAKVSSEIEPVV